MAWSWSHSQEAYQNAHDNLENLDKKTLNVIFAEWHGCEGNNLDDTKYEKALARAERTAHDVLVDFIWEKMSEQAICDNGGFEAWCCPFGCGCHKVPFDEEIS